AKGDVLAGNFVERDHQVVGRDLRSRCHASIDVFQQCEPRLLRSALDEGEIENDQVVAIIQPDKLRRVEKALLWKLEDELIEVFGWYAKVFIKAACTARDTLAMRASS